MILLLAVIAAQVADVATVDRFWSKVDRRGPNECWEWKASLHRGYGIFGPRIDRHPAHRFSYELLIGPIPEGLQLDHLCRNRACVNPAHLEPVTPRTNTLRGVSPAADRAKRTHCSVGGHPLAGENLYVDKRGNRRCKRCHLDWAHRKKARLRGQAA